MPEIVGGLHLEPQARAVAAELFGNGLAHTLRPLGSSGRGGCGGIRLAIPPYGLNRDTPEKPCATRLKRRDVDGSEHSKLLLSKPEPVLAVAVRRETEPLFALAGLN